jgi:hypothetical protein
VGAYLLVTGPHLRLRYITSTVRSVRLTRIMKLIPIDIGIDIAVVASSITTTTTLDILLTAIESSLYYCVSSTTVRMLCWNLPSWFQKIELYLLIKKLDLTGSYVCTNLDKRKAGVIFIDR